MTTGPDIITQIQAVLQADPALQAQLKSCTDADSAAALIVQAAASQGIVFSQADLAARAKATPPLPSAAVSDDGLDGKTAGVRSEISDAELELVSGGGVYNMTDPKTALMLEEAMRGLITAPGGASLIKKSMSEASDAPINKI